MLGPPPARSAPDRAPVDAHIARLIEMGRTTNPLQLLSAATFQHLLHRESAEGGVERGDGSEAQVEYLMSLLLAQPFPAAPRERTEADVDECLGRLEDAYQRASVYYAVTSGARARGPEEEELIASLRMDTMHVRGAGYRQHLDWLFQEIAAPHDAALRAAVGFDSAQLADAIAYVGLTVQRALDQANQVRNETREALYALTASESGQPADRPAVHALALSHDFAAQHPAEVEAALGAFRRMSLPELFAVAPRHGVEALIFDRLALRFGDNVAFVAGIPRWPGWPLNPTRIRARPLIAHAGRFYVFHLPLLARGALGIVEEILKDANPGYWQNRFLRHRDDWVESTAVDLVAGMLPGCAPYKNLYYDCVVDGANVHTEVDGLIVYDDTLLIVEVKASALGDDARRGAPEAIADALRDSLDKAYRQAHRVLDLVRTRDEVRFTDERGAERLRLRFRDFRRHFLISVTRESLGSFATRLHLTRSLGFIQGVEWPWAVSLLDLRIIGELVDRPSLFLHYLVRRLAANEVTALAAQDEIDLFGYFLAGQLFFDGTDERTATHIMPFGFDEEINTYFEAQAAGRELPARPAMQLPAGFCAVLSMLEQARPRNFVTACLDLLSYNGATYAQVAENVPGIEEALRHRGACRQLTLGNPEDASLPVIVLSCCQLGTLQEMQARLQIGANKLRRFPRHRATVILWEPPLSSNHCRVELM